MLRALAAQAGAAARATMRDAVTGAILIAIALVFLIGAIAFGSVAFYLYLLTVTGPVVAALGVAVLFLVAMLLLLLIAMVRTRRAYKTMAPPAGAVPTASVAGLAGDAEALGILLGRNLNGIPLVVTALAVGLMLGRIRR
ncbi:hypothetical protein EDC22_10726 [Tepidamorphus gemmatus]|uniref:Uncharacterized protein n=1 Tax=Tepidamorphus gemmatus TaxID=747076 RepID=A0A4R3M777_9HYPH|nr:hypothetical protein [Tepidamorphus gemmatus]TCT09180.1 hypothetical protein EDC22_10726 [Tepidamorphus gemmatus]